MVYELVPKKTLDSAAYMKDIANAILESNNTNILEKNIETADSYPFDANYIEFTATLEGPVYGIYILNKRIRSVGIMVEARNEEDHLRARMSMSLKFRDGTSPKLVIKSYEGNFSMDYILAKLETPGFEFIKSR